MDKILKPVIFVAPLTLSLKTLRDTMSATAEAEGIEIYNIENIDELNQTLPSIGPSLTLFSNTEKCSQVLKKNKKYIAQFKSKVLLVTQASVSAIDIDKLNKMGLTENMYEPINQKTLLYKVKMLIKSLPALKIEDEQEDEVKTFSTNKDEFSVNTNEKLRLEKGVSTEDGIELDSDSIEDEKALFSLDEYRKKKNKSSELSIESSESSQSSTELELQKGDKKSRLGSLLKSLGSFGKKKSDSRELDLSSNSEERTDVSLDIDSNSKGKGSLSDLNLSAQDKKKHMGQDLLSSEAGKDKLKGKTEDVLDYSKKTASKGIDIEEDLYKKKKTSLHIASDEEKEDDTFNLTLDDVERMRKQGIPLHLPPNLTKDKLEILLNKDPILRKRVLDFKLSEVAKKKKSSVKMVDEVKAKKRASNVKFDLGFVRKNKKEDPQNIREKLLEEKRRLLEKKLEEERVLKALEEETQKVKEPEPEIIYEPNSKSMEKIIDILTIYQDKKMDRLEVFKRSAQTIFELKNGLTSFLSYNEDKKEYEDLFISYMQDFNTDKTNRGEEFWKTMRSEKLKTWSSVKLSSWSDEWFTGNARDAEFIYPVIEGNSTLGLIVIHFTFKENEQITEADSKKIEIFIESTRGVYLERFKSNKEKSSNKDDDLSGDGTSYGKIFKDFFEKIFKKAG